MTLYNVTIPSLKRCSFNHVVSSIRLAQSTLHYFRTQSQPTMEFCAALKGIHQGDSLHWAQVINVVMVTSKVTQRTVISKVALWYAVGCDTSICQIYAMCMTVVISDMMGCDVICHPMVWWSGVMSFVIPWYGGQV